METDLQGGTMAFLHIHIHFFFFSFEIIRLDQMVGIDVEFLTFGE